jgi:hypothetical protein
MARRVFFSFEYANDVGRAMVVRKSNALRRIDTAGFIDSAEFEKLQQSGEDAIRRWIDGQLTNTSVTVVLVGRDTCSSKWVRYEIEQSKKRGNGLLGVDISKIRNFHGQTTERCGRIPTGYPFYLWNNDDGYENLGVWIEEAAKAAGR